MSRQGPRYGAGRSHGVSRLSSREVEVLELLADGHTNFSAAARLRLSEETIKSHVRHILGKLDAQTRTHAVAIAIREQLI
jgi:DNA-binding CsgD family transcriptional regulator